jgi:hypothetical protein
MLHRLVSPMAMYRATLPTQDEALRAIGERLLIAVKNPDTQWRAPDSRLMVRRIAKELLAQADNGKLSRR